MRLCLAAVLLLGALAFASATDPSTPKHGTGRPTCILPIKRLQCIRDWRSGFVAGVRYGYGETTVTGWSDVCSNRIGNQTLWDMSDPAAVTKIDADDGVTGSPPENSPYYYPPWSPITQVIVLEAQNPWGPHFGNIPAILFGYIDKDDGQLNFAVCGNAAYAQFYLNPSAFPPPPTPVTLKQVFTSPLSDDTPAFLGGFLAKCSTRGTGYLGGDPNTSSKYFIKKLSKVCFAPLAHVNITEITPPSPFKPSGDYSWWENINYAPCHYDKHAAKKSASVSCAATGQVLATGKYGAIVFNQAGDAYEWEQDPEGNYEQTPYGGAISMGTDPEPSYLSATAGGA